MAIQLVKNASATIASNSLNNVLIGLGWRAGNSFDLDACVFMLSNNGRVVSDDYFIFFNQMQSPDGAVRHQGDNLVGGTGQNDDEQIHIDLSRVNQQVEKIVIAVSIYDARTRGQNFGQIRSAYCRLVDQGSNEELMYFDLSEDYSYEISVVMGEIYRSGRDWHFRALGEGYQEEIDGLCRRYGVTVN